jgi:hypothetical protein
MIGLQVLFRRDPRCQETWPRMLSATQTCSSLEIRGITFHRGTVFPGQGGLKGVKGWLATQPRAQPQPPSALPRRPYPMTTNRVDG